MSQVPDETLRKVTLYHELLGGTDRYLQILTQIQQRALQSQRALQVTKTQSSAKEREKRIAQITIGEINALDSQTRLYRSAGKMSASMSPLIISNT